MARPGPSLPNEVVVPALFLFEQRGAPDVVGQRPELWLWSAAAADVCGQAGR
jgi:hypothetical protein